MSTIRWSPPIPYFLSLGYAFIEPNVRGSSGFGRAYEMADNGPKRLDAFKDIEATGRWAAAQPWADPTRVVIIGGSYGGYEIFKVEFGDLDQDGPFLDSISPIADVGKISRPLFVYAGANDPRVPRPESDQIVKALRAQGVAVEYMVAADEGHSLSRRPNQLAFFARVARFLESVLR